MHLGAAGGATEAVLGRFDEVRDFCPQPCYGRFSDDIVTNGGFEQVGGAWTTPDTPFPAGWSDLVVHGCGRWSMRVGIANGDVGNPPPAGGGRMVAGRWSTARGQGQSGIDQTRIPANLLTNQPIDLYQAILDALDAEPGEELAGRRGRLPADVLAQLRLGMAPAGYAYSSARQEVLIPADAMTATLALEQYPASSDQGPPGSINTDAQYGLAIEADGSFTVLYWDYRLNDQRWLHRQIDMLPYRGRPITLHFGTRNQGDSLRTVQFVDDVHLWVCSPSPPPPLPPNAAALGEDFLVTDAASAQYDPAVAFNGEDDEFLLVWEDFRAGGLPDIWSQRVSYDGRLLGDAVPQVVDSDIQSDPQVAYLASADRYLVVWQDNRNGPDSPDVYGQLVRRDGLPDGPNFSIAAGPGGQVSVRIAASSADNSWLVVWGDATAGSSSVKAQRVSGSGALAGPVIAVSDGSGWAGQPTVADSTAAATYFVAWVDNRAGSSDIYAQTLRLDGVLLDSNFAVSSAPGGQEWPSVPVSGWGYTGVGAWPAPGSARGAADRGCQQATIISLARYWHKAPGTGGPIRCLGSPRPRPTEARPAGGDEGVIACQPVSWRDGWSRVVQRRYTGPTLAPPWRKTFPRERGRAWVPGTPHRPTNRGPALTRWARPAGVSAGGPGPGAPEVI